MRKIVALFIFVIFCTGCSSTGAMRTEMNFFRQLQYKFEMESIINKSIPTVHQAGEEWIREAELYRDTIFNNDLSEDSEECRNLSAMYDNIESHILINVFADLIKASDKYFKVDLSTLQTDWWVTPSAYIEPYLIKYKVDRANLNNLENYAFEQSKQIAKYIKETDKYCRIYSHNPGLFEN